MKLRGPFPPIDDSQPIFMPNGLTKATCVRVLLNRRGDSCAPTPPPLAEQEWHGAANGSGCKLWWHPSTKASGNPIHVMRFIVSPRPCRGQCCPSQGPPHNFRRFDVLISAVP